MKSKGKLKRQWKRENQPLCGDCLKSPSQRFLINRSCLFCFFSGTQMQLWATSSSPLRAIGCRKHSLEIYMKITTTRKNRRKINGDRRFWRRGRRIYTTHKRYARMEAKSIVRNGRNNNRNNCSNRYFRQATQQDTQFIESPTLYMVGEGMVMVNKYWETGLLSIYHYWKFFVC